MFEFFNRDIAQQIGMQDFSLDDTEYYYDNNSEHQHIYSICQQGIVPVSDYNSQKVNEITNR